MFFPLNTKCFMCPCAQPRLTALMNRDLFHHAWTQAYCLLSARLFPCVWRPLAAELCRRLAVTLIPRDFRIVSSNCEPSVSLMCLHCSPVVENTKSCFMYYSLQRIIKRRRRRAAVCLRRRRTGLIETHLRHYIFGVPFPWCLHLLPCCCLSVPCMNPHRRPLALTACCAACLSLFYQPHFALYGCSSCILWMSLPLPYSLSPTGTRGQNVDE